MSENRLKGLYVITDEDLINEDQFKHIIESALQGGASIIQYRDKSDDQEKRLHQARILRSLCEQYQTLCLINDDIELARAVGADGVHLGKEDASISQARAVLGTNAIIGISCYDDIPLALTAEKNNADYVAFGAIFSSRTKKDAKVAGLEILSRAEQQLSLPICAIGGITRDNVESVIESGADMVAVISSVFTAKDTRQSTKELNRHFLSLAD
ncbi:MAG TPA: thiamine phosphate synthase [Gammaproteobacteria bacterium]|nr:thiamine phosphate synthase [Gammaproteobacteria bacterium]